MKYLKTTLVYVFLFIFSFLGIMSLMADLFKSEVTLISVSTIIIFSTFLYFHEQEFKKKR